MLSDTFHLSHHLWPRASLSLVRGFLICVVSFAQEAGEIARHAILQMRMPWVPFSITLRCVKTCP